MNFHRTRVVGIWAPAPQSGKSTAARHIESLANVSRVNFADQLRRMIRDYLWNLGVPPSEVVRYMEDGAFKEEVIPGVGKSFVDLMIAFGTTAGRKEISENIWVNVWTRRAQDTLPHVDLIVADDVRFRNEAEAIRGMGGVMLGILRPGATVSASRAAAEGHLTFEDMDAVVVNDVGISDFLHGVLGALSKLGVDI